MAAAPTKILAIDDHQDNLTVLGALVHDLLPGCTLVTALSGPEGIELALSEDPDVILADLVMPAMDGLELCRRLKADDRLRHIPVVIVTALRTGRDGRIAALQAGAEGFLAKPIDEQVLVAQVRAMVKVKVANQARQFEADQLTAVVIARTAELRQELVERRRTEAIARARTKELETLYALAQIAQQEEITPAKVYQEVADLLPANWQYPEVACARITVDGHVYQTANFTCSPWQQVSTVLVDGQAAGEIRIGYLVERPAAHEGPFLREERLFLDAAAERLGQIHARRQAERQLKLALALERLRSTVLEMTDVAHWRELAAALRRELTGLIRFRGCGINQIDLERRSFTAVLFAVDGAAEEQAYTFLPRSLEQAVTLGQPVYRRNRAELTAHGEILDPRIGSVVDVPYAGGTIAINHSDEHAFTPTDVEILQRFAEVVSLGYRRWRDLAERDRLLAVIEAQRLQAVHLSRLKELGEMATGVAHELNQPLNGIRAFAEGILLGPQVGWTPSPQEIRQVLRDIVTQVDRITEIIDHMRAFARSEPGREAKPFSVTESIDGALKLVGAQLRVHGIAVHHEVGPDLPQAHGWPYAIEQVILNLLSNARDALHERQQRQRVKRATADPEWRPEVTVRAASGADGTSVRVEVGDNGGGIPPQILERIFEPFFTTKDVGKGTGIGLAIAQNIIERHAGRMEVDNRPGDGVVFTVVLPAAAPPEHRHGCRAVEDRLDRSGEEIDGLVDCAAAWTGKQEEQDR